jgi:proteasome accessory factor B
VRPGAGAVLRRNAAAVEPDVAGPDERTPWDRLRLPGGAQADELLAFGPDVYVEAPASLRDEVVTRLRAGVTT